MNRLVVAIVSVLGIFIVLISFGVKKIVIRESSGLVEKIDSENKESIFQLARGYMDKNEYVKARDAFREFLKKFPAHENAPRAAEAIEDLNIKIIFSDIVDDKSVLYEIKPGDTLAKIASKYNTTVELIKKSNNLKTDLIYPGKKIKVNSAKFSILVDKTDNMLRLKRGEEIVKTYQVSTGRDFSTPVGTFKIEEKLVSPLWYKVGAVVSPDNPDYELGSRWMGLSEPEYGIHGTKDPATIGQHITNGCVRMRNAEVEELYAIVPSGTEVTIVE